VRARWRNHKGWEEATGNYMEAKEIWWWDVIGREKHIAETGTTWKG
jgi:hypothetical protein